MSMSLEHTIISTIYGTLNPYTIHKPVFWLVLMKFTSHSTYGSSTAANI